MINLRRYVNIFLKLKKKITFRFQTKKRMPAIAFIIYSCLGTSASKIKPEYGISKNRDINI